MSQTTENNILGTGKISSLLSKFAMPSIVAMLVSALYNIVDQFFIGHTVGMLGNAATNVAFPLTTICISCALLFGIGGAANFNLSMGRGEKDKAAFFAGNSISMLVISGVVIALITTIFLKPLLLLFGSTSDVLEYAMPYVRITAIGFPFMILTAGGGHLMRADGSPKMAMLCNIIGAVINTILDAIFVMGLGWGMQGAALATIIGQILSAVVVINYLLHYKTVKLTKSHIKPSLTYISRISALGIASFFNQIAITIVQIVLNNLMTYYGALSIYGESIPLSCSGIIIKVSQVMFSIVIGISQGVQPILSFNYGAKNYDRVRNALKLALIWSGSVAVVSFIAYQLFPRQIIAIFGSGESELYFEFGVKFIRIYLFGTIVMFLQPIASNYFSSIGKAYKGMILALTRQIISLLPLLIILSSLFGIDGIMYAGCIAEFIAFIVSVIMLSVELKKMKALEIEGK